MFENYLQALRAQAGIDSERHVSVESLAKTAGITLPENVCPECAGEMQKLGSIWKCTCGMMKSAEPFYKKPLHPALAALAGAAGGYSGASLAGASPMTRAMSAIGGGVGLGGAFLASRRAHEARQLAAQEQDMLMGHQRLNPEQQQMLAQGLSHIVDDAYARGEVVGAESGEQSPFQKKAADAPSTAERRGQLIGGVLGGVAGIPLGAMALHRTLDVLPNKRMLNLAIPAALLGGGALGTLGGRSLGGRIGRAAEKHAEVIQPKGVLDTGHTDGMKTRDTPHLDTTPAESGDQGLGDRHQGRSIETVPADSAVGRGLKDIGPGPTGVTYELTNNELVKKVASGMPRRR
jgi:hypothetical protein